MHLTRWGRVTHICVSDLTSIGSDNDLSPGRRQAIIRTNAGKLLIRPLGTNFNEFLVEILIFSFKKMRLKVSSAKRRPFCLGLNELKLPSAKCRPFCADLSVFRWPIISLYILHDVCHSNALVPTPQRANYCHISERLSHRVIPSSYDCTRRERVCNVWANETNGYACNVSYRRIVKSSNLHDNVIKWKHFPRYWPFVRGIYRPPVNSPHKGRWRGALMFSLIHAWTNSWANNGDTGDLRRHRAHYDVSVMEISRELGSCFSIRYPTPHPTPPTRLLQHSRRPPPPRIIFISLAQNLFHSCQSFWSSTHSMSSKN